MNRVRTRVAALLAVVVSLLALPAASASATDSLTSVVALSLYPGRDTSTTGTRASLGLVKVYEPGTYQATLTATVSDNNPDPVQYVAVSLICKEETSIEDQIGAASNISHGETRRLVARVTFHVTKRAACFAYGSTSRLSGGATSPSNRRLGVRATLALSPVSDRTVDSRRFIWDDANRGYSGHSFLARPGQFAHAGELSTRLTGAGQAKVSGSAYLTACAFLGGSRDATTGGRDLCTRSVVRRGSAGTLLRLRLVVRQYTPGGAVCRTTVVPGTTTWYRITANRHHLPVSVQGTVDLAGAEAGCGTTARAWTEVRVSTGPSVVVHWPSTATSFQPL